MCSICETRKKQAGTDTTSNFHADAPCFFARKFTMAPTSRSGLLAVHCLHIHLLLKTFPLKGFMLSSRPTTCQLARRALRTRVKAFCLGVLKNFKIRTHANRRNHFLRFPLSEALVVSLSIRLARAFRFTVRRLFVTLMIVGTLAVEAIFIAIAMSTIGWCTLKTRI